MLQTRKGSEDGFTVRQFVEGEIYEVRENLARSFFAAGWATRVEVCLKVKKRKREES